MNKFSAIQRLRNLHSDQGGQSIIFVALVLFTLVSFMALVINVGHRTEQKVEIQLGTDAAALSGGTWIARGLNTICILNVSMTQTLAWIIFLQAFKRTNTAAQISYIANQVAAAVLCAIIFTAPVGCPWQAGLNVIRPYMKAMDNAAKKVPAVVKKLWKFMDYCRKAEDVVAGNRKTKGVGTVGAMSVASTINVAKKNISNLGTVPAALFPVGTMPTKVGKFKDICDRTHDGGPGYDNFFEGIAPINMKFLGVRIKEWFALVWLPAIIVIPPPLAMNYLFMELESNSLCPGKGKESGNLKGFTVSCSECDTKGYKYNKKGKKVTVPGESTWQGGVFEVTGQNSDTEKNTGLEDGNVITLKTKKYNSQGKYTHTVTRKVNGRDFGEVKFTGGSPSLVGKGTVEDDPALYPHSWCQSYSAGTCDMYSVPTVNDAPGSETIRTTAIIISITQGEQKKECVKGKSPCTVTQFYKAQRIYYEFEKTVEIIDYDNSDPPIEIGRHNEHIWVQKDEERYYKEEWTMTKCEYTEEHKSTPRDTSKRAKPLVLSDNWEDETNYLALVFKDVEDQLTLGSATGGGNPKGTVAMAQVKIYNASGDDDLFNQDWHARLAPVNIDKVSLSFFGMKVPIPPKLKSFISNFAGTVVVH